MSQRRGLVLLVGLVACAALGWVVVSSTSASGESSPESVVDAPASLGAAMAPDRRALGVGARAVDPVAAPQLAGMIEDPDGAPIVEGRVRLSCLSRGSEEVVEVEVDGSFRGSGCARVCAEFIHPTMIQTEAWVLTAGREEVWTVRPLGRHGGVVTSPGGEPVAAAMLHLDPSSEPMGGAPLRFTSANTVSDADGRFSFAVAEEPPCDPCRAARGRCVEGRSPAPGEVRTLELSAGAPGYRSVRRRVSTGSDEAWMIVLAPAVTTRGRLVDEDGQSYPRARILARSTEHPSEVHRASLEGAEFELGELGEGAFEVRAVQDGIELASAEGIVAGDEIELLGGLPAVGARLTLQLVSGEGGGVPGVLVDGGPFVAAESDARGELRATQVLPGAYVLRLRPPGGGALRHRLMVRDGELSLTEQVSLEPGP